MHDHAHGTGGLRQEAKSSMLLVLAVTSAYMLVEVVAGVYTGSLALLADAGHMLGDVASLILALVAFWFSSRPPNPIKTYGYYRTEIFAALINGVVLVGLAFFILYEAYQRISDPPSVSSVPMLVVALLGLAVNVVSVKLLSRGAEKSLNVKAAYLEVLSDLMATGGVLIAAVVMLATKWYMIDPIVSGAIGLMILPRTWSLLAECTNILMEGAPGHVDLADLRTSMLAVPGVVDVHDIHVWTITSGLDAMSGHVTIDKDSPADHVLSEITLIAQDKFGLHHTTVQVEQVECKGQTSGACGT